MSQQIVVRKRVDRVAEDPERFWLERLDVDTRKAARICFRQWLRWLREKPGFETATSRDLIVRRITGDDPYEFVDLKQEFIGGLIMRKASKGKFQWAIDSFFMHNRAELPRDRSALAHSFSDSSCICCTGCYVE